jgi:hypothetical protein
LTLSTPNPFVVLVEKRSRAQSARKDSLAPLMTADSLAMILKPALPGGKRPDIRGLK